MLLICFHESFLFGVAVADPTLENKPDLDPAQIRNSDMQDPDPAFFFSGYQLGYSDYDVFLESDEGSRVYRCKKLF